jgi:hypothetical protein
MARKKLTQKLTGFPFFQVQTNGFTFPLTHSFTKDFVGLDGLSLDLQFATDKTLTARKGPTPTFTRASTATFVGSDGLIQSAAINTARFDHDPITLACKGLLIEESKTNLFARSAELGNAYWTNSNLSISSDDQTSPDGGLNAETITVSAGTPSIYRAVTCTASTVYTLSFYIKIGTLTPSDFKFAVRDDTNGVFIAENITPNVTPVTTEWRRVTYTFTTPVGCVTVRPYLVRYGYISAGTFFLWGAQLEAGAFPTSYIPTTTASVVRSADVCSITGSAFTGFYNQSEGTLFANTQSTGSGDRRPVAFDIGNNSQFYNFYATSALSRYAQASGSLGSFTMAGTVPSTPLLYAGTLKHGDYSLALNGSIVGSSAVSLGATFTTLRIGAGGGGGGQFLCGHLASIRYYKKRLSNAKLVTITV